MKRLSNTRRNQRRRLYYKLHKLERQAFLLNMKDFHNDADRQTATNLRTEQQELKTAIGRLGSTKYNADGTLRLTKKQLEAQQESNAPYARLDFLRNLLMVENHETGLLENHLTEEQEKELDLLERWAIITTSTIADPLLERWRKEYN